MSRVLKHYPVPWKIVERSYIETANGQKLMFGHDPSLLEFIVETVNNSIGPRITDQPCKCPCGWEGVVWDCEPDVDGDGSLGCPECMKVIENI